MTLDHVIPRSRGGGDTWENIVTACVKCNIKKGNRTPKEAKMNIINSSKKPYSSLQFEIFKHTKANFNREWHKYIIGI